MISSREILREGLEGLPSSDHNLLVISDLHLGDSLRPSQPGYLKELARLNRALGRFLKHYAKHRVAGKPWRLVVAGDFIDFLHAGLYGDQEAHGADDHVRERAFNHCSEEDAILWLEQVMVRERRVFRMLASFVGAGHDLVVIKGNHDAQFHFEGVQRRFTQLLLEIQLRRLLMRRRDASTVAQEVVDFTRRIHFCRWFYYERDFVYIEHGNQYDAFCSFDSVLSPLDADLYELADPIGHRTYRAFAKLLRSLDLHLIDQWRFFDYVKWIAGLGPKLIGQLAYTYFASISWMMRTKRSLLLAAKRARREHLVLRKALIERFGLSEETLHALDELRARPAGNSVLTGLRMLYMDRVALGLLNLIVGAGMIAAPGPGWLRASISAVVAVASVAANVLLDRAREVDPHPKLKRISRKIARLLKVPFVVFGHSHRALMESAQDEDASQDVPSWYFNTGSWTGGPEGLTHVCILRDETKKAELRRWCLTSQKPLMIHESIPSAQP